MTDHTTWCPFHVIVIDIVLLYQQLIVLLVSAETSILSGVEQYGWLLEQGLQDGALRFAASC
jgi:hypothetical protein